MFGDMMNNMKEQQEAMQVKLREVEVSISKDGLQIKANAAREILDISINEDLFQDKDQLEDILIVSLNKLMQEIAVKESEASQELMNNMLPGGLSGLGGLFS